MEEETGQRPAALDRRPEVDPAYAEEWETFWLLAGDRTPGFDGPGPIPYRAISAYCRDTGMTDPEDFLPFCRLIQAMDAAGLKFHRKRKPKPT